MLVLADIQLNRDECAGNTLDKSHCFGNSPVGEVQEVSDEFEDIKTHVEIAMASSVEVLACPCFQTIVSMMTIVIQRLRNGIYTILFLLLCSGYSYALPSDVRPLKNR